MHELIEGQDYQVVDDGMGDLKSYLTQTTKNAVRKTIGFLNKALSGNKGKAATMALLMADLTTDKEAFNAVYKKHSGPINEYFEHVDLNAVSAMIGVDDAVAQAAPKAIVKGAAILTAGIIIGVAGLTLYNRKTS